MNTRRSTGPRCDLSTRDCPAWMAATAGANEERRRALAPLWRAGVWSLWCSLQACHSPAESLTPDSARPRLSELEVLGTIRSGDFTPSGIVHLEDCITLAVGADWGTLAVLDLSTGAARLVGSLPGGPRDAHLRQRGASIIAWWPDGRSIAWIDPDSGVYRITHPQDHQWSIDAGGPATIVSPHAVAVLPLGDGRRVPSPQPERVTAEIEILRADGSRVASLGQVAQRGGRYLTATLAEGALTTASDTLVVLRLTDGRLERWVQVDSSGDWALSGTHALISYFLPPEPWEEVWQPPWLINGAQVRVHWVPHVAVAYFSSYGLVTVRNGGATWTSDDTPYARRIFSRPGGWIVDAQWLEFYDFQGRLMGAFSPPQGRVSRIAGGGGLLFFWGEGREIRIVRDPYEDQACRDVRLEISIALPDTLQEPPQ